MTNKLIITSIVILTSITVGIVSLTQVHKSNTKVAMVSSSSSVLSSDNLVQQSSTITTEYNSSQLDQAKLGNPESKPKVENESTPLRQLNVEVLDSNNPPQYITDYLACQKTSPTKQFGTLIDTEDGKLEYKCPKSLEYYGCKTSLDWGDWTQTKGSAPGTKYVEGWTCDVPAFGRGGASCAYNFQDPINELGILEVNKIKIAALQSGSGCVVLLNRNLTNLELKLLQNYKSPLVRSLKLITIKN